MIIRHLPDILGTHRHVTGNGFESRRMMLADDAVGYSLHDTVVKEGAELHLQYKNHVEANYCIAGEGEVEDVATGEVHLLRPGSLYTLDQNDPHILRATKGNLRLICVFTPALTGREKHDADGSYGVEC